MWQQGYYIFLFSNLLKPQELSACWSDTCRLTNHPPLPALRRLNVSYIFIAFSDFQSKWLAGLWRELRLSHLHESFMLFSSQLFGCIWLEEAWSWPNGGGHMAAPDVLLLYMHSSSKTSRSATLESVPSVGGQTTASHVACLAGGGLLEKNKISFKLFSDNTSCQTQQLSRQDILTALMWKFGAAGC